MASAASIYEYRFARGQKAALRGKSRGACPYKTDDARGAWLAGWSSIRGR